MTKERALLTRDDLSYYISQELVKFQKVEDYLLSKEELAVALNLKNSTIFKLQQAGMPQITINKTTVKYRKDDVLEWLVETYGSKWFKRKKF